MKTKYLNKLYLPEKYIIVLNTVDGGCLNASTDITKLLSMIPKIPIKHRDGILVLSIYNNSADNLVINSKSSIKESKDELAKHAYHRYVFMSFSLDQIYGESFCLWTNQDNINDYNSPNIRKYCYDYGLLYSKHELYHENEHVRTNYLRYVWNDNIDNYIGCLNVSLHNQDFIKDHDSSVNLNEDIRFCYNTTSLDSIRTEKIILNSDLYNGNWFIPVATFLKSKI